MMNRRLVLVALAILAIGGTAGSAVAAPTTGEVKTYTACLTSSNGVINKIKEGNAPSSPCASGQITVSFSAGDITKISVTGALTGGGDNGEVTIGLKPEFTLPSECSTGAVAKWNGTAWACATDQNTTYSAGTGLDLTGTTFSVDPDYRVKNTPDCPSGEFATGFDSSGTIACGAPTAAGPKVYAALENPASGIGIPDDGAYHTVVSLTVPAGTYSITSIGAASQAVGDREWGLSCRLLVGANVVSESYVSGPDGIDHRTFALMNVNTFAGPAALSVGCATTDDGVGVRFLGLQAITVG